MQLESSRPLPERLMGSQVEVAGRLRRGDGERHHTSVVMKVKKLQAKAAK